MRTRIDMAVGGLAIMKEPCTLSHILHPHMSPGDIGRIPMAGDGYTASINQNTMVITFDFSPESPHHGIVLEKMGKRCIIGQIIDRNNLDIFEKWVHACSPENISADPSETVYADFNCHALPPLYFLVR
jgi:hypothetical protein